MKVSCESNVLVMKAVTLQLLERITRSKNSDQGDHGSYLLRTLQCLPKVRSQDGKKIMNTENVAIGDSGRVRQEFLAI